MTQALNGVFREGADPQAFLDGMGPPAYKLLTVNPGNVPTVCYYFAFAVRYQMFSLNHMHMSDSIIHPSLRLTGLMWDV